MSTPAESKRSENRFSIGNLVGAFAVVVLIALGALQFRAGAAGAAGPVEAEAVAIPPLSGAPSADPSATSETVVFAGGCFWGVQGVFQHTRGVTRAVSGYAGGSAVTASYEIVSAGVTDHAEVVQVTFDPRQISYAQLLQIYFSVVHDPTQLNRQGPDRGAQYRSAVFHTNPVQQQTTERYIGQLDAANVFGSKIVTTVQPLTAFYPAEAYHQDYATLHPDSGYIATFDLPKIANLKRLFASRYRDEPVLVAADAPRRGQ